MGEDKGKGWKENFEKRSGKLFKQWKEEVTKAWRVTVGKIGRSMAVERWGEAGGVSVWQGGRENLKETRKFPESLNTKKYRCIRSKS